jgi:hypothetical protein
MIHPTRPRRWSLGRSASGSATSRTMTRAYRWRGLGTADRVAAMNWHRWLATLLIMLALTACAQGGQVQTPYSPENMHDRGGDGGGGGGGGGGM